MRLSLTLVVIEGIKGISSPLVSCSSSVLVFVEDVFVKCDAVWVVLLCVSFNVVVLFSVCSFFYVGVSVDGKLSLLSAYIVSVLVESIVVVD